MTAFYLIRHGSVAGTDESLAGRSAVALSDNGRREVQRMAERLRALGLAAIYASPLPRTRETAVEVAKVAAVPVVELEGLSEIELGSWSGRTFEELEKDPLWRRFNSFRSGTSAPGGELMLEVQARAVREVLRLREVHAGARVGLVSHADVLRAVLCYFLGMPLDLALRIEISPASVSLLVLFDDGANVVFVNRTEDLPEP